jgi:hypothetical protein
MALLRGISRYLHRGTWDLKRTHKAFVNIAKYFSLSD